MLHAWCYTVSARQTFIWRWVCVLQESALIWNKTTVISIQAETVREQTEQITVDMDEIERRLRELEQQADEDERLIDVVCVAVALLIYLFFHSFIFLFQIKRQLWNYIHRRHLLLLSRNADTHYTVPLRIEGWVDLDGWLHTQMVYLPDSNRAQCRLTTLIEAKALTTTPHRHHRIIHTFIYWTFHISAAAKYPFV